MRRLLWLLLILCFSCSTDEGLVFENRTLVDFNCEECTKVHVQLPFALGNQRNSRRINQQLEKEVIALLDFDEQGKEKNLEAAVESFNKEHHALQDRFPDGLANWEAEINGILHYSSLEYISIKLESYLFTGGAHGNTFTKFLTFNALTGRAMDLKTLFKDWEGLVQLAESKFREKEQIPEEVSINYTGLMFQNDSFHMPENIGLNEEGLVLYYNVYEISSYADGPLQLALPFQEINPFLKNPESLPPLD